MPPPRSKALGPSPRRPSTAGTSPETSLARPLASALPTSYKPMASFKRHIEAHDETAARSSNPISNIFKKFFFRLGARRAQFLEALARSSRTLEGHRLLETMHSTAYIILRT